MLKNTIFLTVFLIIGVILIHGLISLGSESWASEEKELLKENLRESIKILPIISTEKISIFFASLGGILLTSHIFKLRAETSHKTLNKLCILRL